MFLFFFFPLVERVTVVLGVGGCRLLPTGLHASPEECRSVSQVHSPKQRQHARGSEPYAGP